MPTSPFQSNASRFSNPWPSAQSWQFHWRRTPAEGNKPRETPRVARAAKRMPIIKEERLQKYDAEGFKFDRMKAEVSDAIKEDWKRDAVDDAKKRAITTTANYDEFRQRVAGCHLKPIHKNEFNAPPKFAYNRQSEQASATSTPIVPATVIDRVAGACKQGELRNMRELDKELRRRQTAEERAELVLRMAPDSVKRVFREMDAEVFQKVLESLEQADRGAVPLGAARQFLSQMATLCPSSTSQAAAFFSVEERGLVTRLLARDEAQVEDPEVVRLCASWGITTSSLAAVWVVEGQQMLSL
ncbi:unnamed protein product [Effrenium voratum]|nr:unnamed protein product [Effrenium voratum]